VLQCCRKFIMLAAVLSKACNGCSGCCSVTSYISCNVVSCSVVLPLAIAVEFTGTLQCCGFRCCIVNFCPSRGHPAVHPSPCVLWSYVLCHFIPSFRLMSIRPLFDLHPTFVPLSFDVHPSLVILVNTPFSSNCTLC